MKHINLILGLSTFTLLTIVGILAIHGYHLHKENKRLRSDEYDWSDV